MSYWNVYMLCARGRGRKGIMLCGGLIVLLRLCLHGTCVHVVKGTCV